MLNKSSYYIHMDQDIYFIIELATFFKHCINIAYFRYSIPNLNECPPCWSGWDRCKITPFITNQTIFDNAFIADLQYTIQEYLQWNNMCCKSKYTIKRTGKLLEYVITNVNIIDTLNTYKHLLPTESYVTNDIINEDWNVKWMFNKINDISIMGKTKIYDDYKKGLTIERLVKKYDLKKNVINNIIEELNSNIVYTYNENISDDESISDE